VIPSSVHDDVERPPNWPLLLEQAWSWGCRRAGRSGAPAPRVETGKLRSIAYAPRTRFERAIAEHRQSAAQRRGCPTADKGALRCIRISASASGQSPEYHTLEIQRASIERTARNHGHELVDVLTAEDQSGRTRNRPQFGIAVQRTLVSEADAIIAWKAGGSAKPPWRNSLHTYPGAMVHCHRWPRRELLLAHVASLRSPHRGGSRRRLVGSCSEAAALIDRGLEAAARITGDSTACGSGRCSPPSRNSRMAAPSARFSVYG